MADKTMGEIIAARRKEKGMTQKELAERMNVTDKAVSKWERDLAYPDIGSVPRLAELLDVSVEELLTGKQRVPAADSGTAQLADLILKAIPLAMGVAAAVAALLGELEPTHGFAMLGVGMACIAVLLLKKK